MLKHVLITGDMHSRIGERLQYIKDMMPEYLPEETVVIVLGDFGANYYLSKHDWKIKHHAAKFGYTIYALRGNHEQRASLVKNMGKVYDEFVHGYVYMEQEFPNIRYFMDCVAEYEIMGKKILCIPGAYSVDKWYRLENDWQWFAEEQLTTGEMRAADEQFSGKYYDFVFSHTCPVSWEPDDLFLSMIDQSTVDKTMEVWMDKFKEKFLWKHWLFGHFHADRLERPYVEQFYTEVEDLDSIIARWDKYTKTKELDWWLPRSPNFYMGIEE
jgi:3-oxoacid CoA-transferase subunit A